MAMAAGDVVTGLRGAYRVEARHAEGAFGVTYRAREVTTGAPVILKELRIERLDDWKALELFEREGRVLEQLSHPNIPAFHDFFAHGAPTPLPVAATSSYAGPELLSLVLVQQLIEGATLQQRVDRGEPLPPAEAESVLRALLGALRYLHERSPPLIHRDIKPGNIILTGEGEPYLVDFGAIQDRLRSAGSVGSTIVGTLGYMPLEQLRGDARPASDLYALGVTVVVAMAGEALSEVAFDDATGTVDTQAALPVTTPVRLREALDAMVAPLLGQRARSAVEVLARLDAPPPSPPPPAPPLMPLIEPWRPRVMLGEPSPPSDPPPSSSLPKEKSYAVELTIAALTLVLGGVPVVAALLRQGPPPRPKATASAVAPPSASAKGPDPTAWPVATPVMPPASCRGDGPGRSDCNGESCCTTLAVPGGTYSRAWELDAHGTQKTSHPATVSAFKLDKYLVTVGRFRRFVDYLAQRGARRPADGSGKHAHLNGGLGLADIGGGGAPAYERGWDDGEWRGKIPTGFSGPFTSLSCDPKFAAWTPAPGPNELRPMNCLSWVQAYAFCIWDGGFLPSEAEWELAAAGGDELRTYPWGNQPPGEKNQYAIFGFQHLQAYPKEQDPQWDGRQSCFFPQAGLCTGVENLAPVGSAPLGAGRWGHLDLAGEVWEWVLDTSAQEPGTWPYVEPCVDCARLTASADGKRSRDYRLLRGGSYNREASDLRTTHRSHSSMSAKVYPDYGVRCARSP